MHAYSPSKTVSVILQVTTYPGPTLSNSSPLLLEDLVLSRALSMDRVIKIFSFAAVRPTVKAAAEMRASAASRWA